MDWAERLRPPSARGAFADAERILDAYEAGDYETGIASASPSPHTAFLFTRQGLPMEEVTTAQYILPVAHLLSTAILKQLTPDEQANALSHTPSQTKLFDFAATPHDGKGCIYMILPEGRELDVPAARAELAAMRAMLKESIAPPPISHGERASGSDYWLGPLEEGRAHFLTALVAELMQYHGQELVRSSDHYANGKLYIRCHRGDMTELLAREGIGQAPVQLH